MTMNSLIIININISLRNVGTYLKSNCFMSNNHMHSALACADMYIDLKTIAFIIFYSTTYLKQYLLMFAGIFSSQ